MIAAQQFPGVAQIRVHPQGRTLSLPAGGRWRHPWWTRVVWLADVKRWVAVVRPGYVNGIAPVVQVTRYEMEESAQAHGDFGTNPLTGEAYFSSEVFQKDHPDRKAREILGSREDVPLYFTPPLDHPLPHSASSVRSAA